MVDDGSEELPAWNDVSVVREGEPILDEANPLLFSFARHLGRLEISNFPGWVRSFGFAALYAEKFGYDKVVHIESDAFVISDRMQAYINDASEGWIAFWCPLWNRPESGIQVIAGSAMAQYLKIARQDLSLLAKAVVEDTLPFTHVEKRFIGDRYGEMQVQVPRDADFSMQSFPSIWLDCEDFFWWLPKTTSLPAHPAAVLEQYRSANTEVSRHGGANYLRVFEFMSEHLKPRSYFEIGSKNGHSMAKFECDTICVDPNLQLDTGVVGRKRRTFLFQLGSDEFFQQESMQRYFGQEPDIGFLDGLHLAEFLLRDFMNFEQAAHARSVAVLHDCLPLNKRMAERHIIRGGNDEPDEERDYWTGDVWKLLFVLKRFRPDLNIFCLDSPPTGLVMITGLDRTSTVLRDRYGEIIQDFANTDLDGETFAKLWKLFPITSSEAFLRNPADFKLALGFDARAIS